MEADDSRRLGPAETGDSDPDRASHGHLDPHTQPVRAGTRGTSRWHNCTAGQSSQCDQILGSQSNWDLGVTVELN